MNAQARGARAARLYKRAKSKLIALDQFCVQKARKHRLPAWTGHLPVTTLTGILIAGVIFWLTVICEFRLIYICTYSGYIVAWKKAQTQRTRGVITLGEAQ